METDERGWIKIYSERYEDSIAGNKEGLLLLKESIDQALKNKSSKVEYKSDFISVICAEEDWENEEVESSYLANLAIATVFFIWLLFLPILGIVLSIKTFL